MDVKDKDRIKYIFVEENNETFGSKMNYILLGSKWVLCTVQHVVHTARLMDLRGGPCQ